MLLCLNTSKIKLRQRCEGPSPSGNIVKLEHELKSNSVKDVRFPSPSGNVVKVEHKY